MTECENPKCKKEAKCDSTMPLSYGIFTGKLCIECAMVVHEDKVMFVEILKQRAKQRKIELPCNGKEFSSLLKHSPVV